MALSGTISQVKDNYGLLTVSITGFAGLNNTTPSFLSQGYPYGSAQIDLTSGAPTADTIALQLSNDGINFATSTTNTANITSTVSTALFSLNVGSIDAPAKFYQFLLSAGGVGTYTITCVLMGSRG